MLVMTVKDNDPRERNRLALAGIAYVVVAALLIWLSIAIYNKSFTDFTTSSSRCLAAKMPNSIWTSILPP